MRRFTALLALDIRQGFWATRKQLLVLVPMFAVLVLAFYVRLGDMALLAETDLSGIIEKRGPFSVGSLLCYFFAGVRPWDVSVNGALPFPAAWLMVLCVTLFLTLRFPLQDLRLNGANVIVLSESRWSWWLSKCAWIAIWTLIPCIAAAVVALIWALVTGSSISLELSDGFEVVIEQAPYNRPAHVGVPTVFLLSVPLWLAAFGLLQLCLSLFTRPVVAFAALFAYLYASAFSASSFLLGNYLMSARSSCLLVDGFDPFYGALLALLVGGISVLAGGFYFQKMDLVDKEYDS